jgi:hypothetical protein
MTTVLGPGTMAIRKAAPMKATTEVGIAAASPSGPGSTRALTGGTDRTPVASGDRAEGGTDGAVPRRG